MLADDREEKLTDRLALEFISALGMPPAEFIALVRRLGIGRVGMAPAPIAANPHGYPAWDLRTDPALLRATKAALAAEGVTVSLGEGFLIMPGIEIANALPNMQLMAELGAPLVNCVVIEQDRQRAYDQFAEFSAMAAAHAMRPCIEFMPLMWPATLGEAAAFLNDCGAPGGGLVLDAMHVFRSAGSTDDCAALEASLIAYVQLCDVPMPARHGDYGMEARDNRLAPGEGDLPLAQFLAAMPDEVTVGLELPMVASAEAGIGPDERLAPAVAAARRLLG